IWKPLPGLPHIKIVMGIAKYLCPLSASAAVTAVTDLHYGYPIIFWTPRDRCSIANVSAVPSLTRGSAADLRAHFAVMPSLVLATGTSAYGCPKKSPSAR